MAIVKIKLSKDKKDVIFVTDKNVEIKTEYGSPKYKWHVTHQRFSKKVERQLRGIHRKLFGFSKERIENVYLKERVNPIGIPPVYFATNFGRELVVRHGSEEYRELLERCSDELREKAWSITDEAYRNLWSLVN